jgi:hypothetical protein
MDDQFGGRTDDDLFSDDFDPPGPAQSAEAPKQPAHHVRTASPAVTTQPSLPPRHSQALPARRQNGPPPKSLAESRHNRPVQQRPHRAQQRQAASEAAVDPLITDRAATATESLERDEPNSATETTTSNAKPIPTGPAAGTSAPAPPPDPKIRLSSGANPRTKLSDNELAAKMAQMRILAAEKTRQFEQAEQDRDAHATAYAREMEAARLRRAEEAERRRRGEDERRRMNDERERNRERKLKAMGAKEGGWDEGKEEVEERGRGGFRGAYGGVRGGRGGLGASRFSERDEEGDTEQYIWRDDRDKGRGRGRGRGEYAGRGARGGRGGKNYNVGGSHRDRDGPVESAHFPALPASKTKGDNAPPKIKDPLPSTTLSPLSPLSPGGRWDDEVAAMAAAANKA